MICNKCGADNDINIIYCTKCGNELKKDISITNEIREINTPKVQNNISIPSENQNIPSQNNSVDTSVNNDIDKKAKKLGIISLILFFLSPILLNKLASNLTEQSKNIVSSISIIFQLVGIIIMIFGRIKYPNSKFLKVVMWIIIVPIALVIMSIILLIGTCYGIINYEG